MFKLEARIERLMNELATLLNKTSTPITEVSVRPGKVCFPCDMTAVTDGFHAYSVGDVWSEAPFDDYALFQFRVDIPALDGDTDCYLRIATNKGGGHNMIRPQMLLMTAIS